MSDKKDKELEDAEDLNKILKNIFGQMGVNADVAFSKFDTGSDTSKFEGLDESHVNELSKVDLVDEFLYTPREIKAHLDRFVIRQDEAKKALSIAVCDHYNHAKFMRMREKRDDKYAEKIEYQKQNVIVMGPTGVGKTYLVKHIAELIGVPFVKADATKFSETGYVGGDVDDLVRELVKKANGDVELAEYGIIYIDEVDKLAGRKGDMRDVGGRGVQTTLLKLMEETEVSARNPNDMKGQMMAMMDLQSGKDGAKESINTRHILFIVSGAFSGIEDTIKKRLGSSEIGFGAEQSKQITNQKLFQHINTQDFIDYGFEAEFIGRLPVRVVCEKLESRDFIEIMQHSEGSLLRQYEREFAAYGIAAEFKESAIEQIANRAEKENTGARALMTVCEQILRDFKYELPGSSVNQLCIDADLIENSDEILGKYCKMREEVNISQASADVIEYTKAIAEKYGLYVGFTKEAVETLALEASKNSISAMKLCQQKFKDYHFGLKLIEKNTGQSKFEIGKDAIIDADKFLSESVVSSYSKAAGEREQLNDTGE